MQMKPYLINAKPAHRVLFAVCATLCLAVCGQSAALAKQNIRKKAPKVTAAIPVVVVPALPSAVPIADAKAEQVSICYNYGCQAEVSVLYSAPRLQWVAQQLAMAHNAAEERDVLAHMVGKLYGWAGEQSLIHNDKPGDYLDDGVPGRMDCIDHAESTSRLLKMLEARQLLRFHKILEPMRRVRWLVAQHFSAVVEERDNPQHRYVIDSWFVAHAQAAIVLPLDDWLAGAGDVVE